MSQQTTSLTIKTGRRFATHIRSNIKAPLDRRAKISFSLNSSSKPKQIREFFEAWYTISPCVNQSINFNASYKALRKYWRGRIRAQPPPVPQYSSPHAIGTPFSEADSTLAAIRFIITASPRTLRGAWRIRYTTTLSSNIRPWAFYLYYIKAVKLLSSSRISRWSHTQKQLPNIRPKLLLVLHSGVFIITKTL